MYTRSFTFDATVSFAAMRDAAAALHYAQRCLREAEVLEDVRLQREALLRLGLVYVGLGDIDAALGAANKAALTVTARDLPHEMRIHYLHAHIHGLRGDVARARESL